MLKRVEPVSVFTQALQLAQSLERYGFECEAGGLESCTEFQQLVDLLRQAGAEAPAHV